MSKKMTPIERFELKQWWNNHFSDTPRCQHVLNIVRADHGFDVKKNVAKEIWGNDINIDCKIKHLQEYDKYGEENK